ncbi:MAG: hypothetical protein F4223_12765 [Rhodobacteraceae bacterium]|nr:hypothetical protein [Paracoccaceae bacterium]
MSHYLKLMMDAIFGRKMFKNEIVWAYTGPSNTKRYFPRKHDIILYYGELNSTFNYDSIRKPYDQKTLARRRYSEGESSIISASAKTLEGRSKSEVENLFGAGKIPEDWWADIPVLTSQKERTGYRTQKPLNLLRRIISASSNKSDMILDPFCGCATTCIAAEELQRQWVGIDIGEKAADLVQMRMKEHLGMLYDGIHRTDIPTRTDLGRLPHYKTHKQTLYGFQGGHCNGCAEHFKPQNLTVDHIIPRSGGGTDHIGNLQLLCGYCNSVKGDRGMEYLIARLEHGNTRRGYMK